MQGRRDCLRSVNGGIGHVCGDAFVFLEETLVTAGLAHVRLYER